MLTRPLLDLAAPLATIGLLIAGCSSSAGTGDDSPSAPGGGKEASEPAVVESHATEVHLIGDWLPNPGPFYEGTRYGQVTGPITGRFLEDNLTIANLECPVTDEAPLRDGVDFAVRCRPDDLDQMVAAGVDAAVLTNDHITDFGPAGIEDTLRALAEADIVAVGPGVEPVTLETVNGPVDILAIPRSGPFRVSDAEAVTMIGDAARDGIPLIVGVHWGRDGARAADPADNELAERLVAAGADVVMGHGAGVLHAFRRVDDAAVFMGLGRFVWPVLDDLEADTAVASVSLVDETATRACLLAATISPSGDPAFDHRDPSC